MKNLLLILLIAFAIDANAQIIWEHTYDSASTDPNFLGGRDQLMIIKFEMSGERYVKINRWGKLISVYDMNHSLLKTISMVTFPMCGSPGPGDLLYFSETLFDTDSVMEFMYLRGTCGASTTPITNIHKEDGSIIFSDTGGAWIRGNFEQQQYPIYNTSQGTKMILSYSNGQAKVFSLPGTLSTAIAEANGQLMQAQGGGGQFSNLYPNPSNGAVTLQYELPKGELTGEIILYNVQGTEVKRYKVDNTFNDILLDNTMLPAGTYFYQLQTGKGAVGTKKMVVVN